MFSDEFYAKVKMFQDAASLKPTKRVPLLSNDYTWRICDSDTGYSYEEAYFDTEKMKQIVCENHERYHFDAYIDLGTRNHFPQMQALGGGSYVLNPETGGINVTDAPTMTADDYRDFAKNPMQYFYIMFQRKFPDITTQDFVNASMAFLKASAYSKEIDQIFAQKYNTPAMCTASASVQAPFEIFHSSFRGIAGISLDMHRHKNDLKEAMEAYWESFVKGSLLRALGGGEHTYIADIYCAMIGHQVMNRRQFEELYWPYLKQIIDAAQKAGKIVFLYVEGSILRFADFFQDIPKGTIILHLEQDDPLEVRKVLPNICIAGGMSTDLLGHGTPAQCVDRAKELIDEMGPGFILGQTKMLSFKNDCRRENLLAVNEFARSYSM